MMTHFFHVFTVTTQAVDLPLYTNELSNNYEGFTALASGYGITNEGKNFKELHLKMR